ncbi:20.1kDa protein [Human adenovirus D8]|uniref:20.1 kDa protein n=1 Tax=Human adenovirus D serotype 8 TaxID=31545 RepID=B9A5C7_ADE08|nr:20.1 kDa protein [Human adenovirus D8]ANW61281.1 20.1 kDa protein [Human adenovirus D8]BAH18791.1 20.1kDa protein [Human adenovirus D8]BAH18863.1 20.1kDa protein [Human adenovirus D8]
MKIFAVLFVVSLIKAEIRLYSGIQCRHNRTETINFTTQEQVNFTCKLHKKYLIWFFNNTTLAVVNTCDNDGVLLPNNLTSGLAFSVKRAKLILHCPIVQGTYHCQSGPCHHIFHLVNVTSSSNSSETNLSSRTNRPNLEVSLRLFPSKEGISPYKVVGYFILGVVLGGWKSIFICCVRHCGEEA